MCKQTDEYWMQIALEEARCAAKQGEIPVGAVIVREGEAIAVAHNLCETLHDATAHAERLAITEAGQRLHRWRLSDCTLYVTLEPCPMCMGAVINARIGRVVYGAKDPHAGACASLLRLQSYPLEVSPDCTGGVLEEASLQVLRDFFKSRRQMKK